MSLALAQDRERSSEGESGFDGSRGGFDSRRSRDRGFSGGDEERSRGDSDGGRRSRGDFGGRSFEFRGPPGGMMGPPPGFGGGGFGGGSFGGGGEFGPPGFRGEGGPPGPPDFGSPPASVSASTQSAPQRTITLKTKDRVTVDLPTTFSDGDLDKDGQIAFYEWRQWKRGDLNGFTVLDHNQDGFLTPGELVKGPLNGSAVMMATAAPSAAPVQATPSTPTVSASTSASNNRNQLVAAVAQSTTSATNPLVTRAESMFRLMDANRDGALSTEEWAKSTKLRPQFETAGIDLSTPMPKDAFVEHFVRLNTQDS